MRNGFSLKIILGISILYAILFLILYTWSYQHGIDYYHNFFLFNVDARQYDAIAHTIVEHHAFSRHFPDIETIRTPVYPVVLAITLYLFGNSFFYFVILLQILCVAATACIVYKIGTNILQSNKLGLLATGLYALLPTTIYYAFVGMTDTLFTLLFIASLYTVRGDTLSYKRSLVGGMLVGLAILTRPIALVSPVAILLAIILVKFHHRIEFRNSIVTVLIFILGLSFILAPWIIRNYRYGYGISISTIGSYNLAYYNAVRFLSFSRHINNSEATDQVRYDIKNYSAAHPHDSLEKAQYAVGLKYISQNIPGYVVFHIIKTAPFFLGSSIKEVVTNLRFSAHPEQIEFADNTSDVFIKKGGIAGMKKLLQEAPYTFESLLRLLTFPFLIVAIRRSYKEKSVFVLLLAAIVFIFAVISSPVANPRYRLPFEPYIFLLILYGITFFSRLKNKIPGQKNQQGI